MRKRFATFALTLVILVSLAPTTFATETNEQNGIFSDEYVAAIGTSSVDPYKVAEDVMASYRSSPEVFVSLLSTLEPTYRDYYIRSLVSTAYYETDWVEFKSQLLRISEKSGFLNATELYNHALAFEEEERAWEDYYKTWKERPQTEGRFNPEVVLEAINNHAGAYPFDTEFCGYLREMYELDPNLFVRTISALPDESIKEISSQIAYANYKNLGDVTAVKSAVDGIPLSAKSLSGAEANIANNLAVCMKQAEKQVAERVLKEEQMQVLSVAEAKSLNPSYIGAISYANVVERPTDLEINKAINCKTSLSQLAANTTYTVELWAQHVGSSNMHKKGTASVTTNSSGKASVSMQVTFSSPGEIMTTIRVYRGTTLVAERTGASPDTVYARWSISLALDANHLGTLYFYYASGAQAYHCDAKGKSGTLRPWNEPNGHTPPGDYYGETGGPSTTDPEAYGPNKFIRMKGNQDPGYSNLYVTGDYVTRARSGLLIHGGRSQESLWSTEGCVRIFDADAKALTDLMDAWRNAGYHQFGRIKITRPGQSL